jgi:pyocin large subunit-like protein
MKTSNQAEEYIQVPFRLFDTIIPSLSSSESVLLLYIWRKTIGSGKPVATIALSDFMEYTQMTKPTVIKHLKRLVESQLIIKSEESIPHTYIIMDGRLLSQLMPELQVKNVYSEKVKNVYLGKVVPFNANKP